MAVITISRQLGSWGCEIARAVADCLGYRMVWREVIHQAASRAGEPEMALAAIDELGLLGLSPAPKARRAYLTAVEAVMREWATEGNLVLVGRAGQVILGDQPGCLHVRIHAPLKLRIERLAAERGISLDASRAQIEASDESRRSFLRRSYGARWDDPLLYDLLVNTARLSIDQAAKLICHAVPQTQPASLSPSP